MSEFRYKHGDRPLEGYTIQHAAGRGGFGEVYYAVSDSGREVALKVIQGYEQIELRGVSQCMNLKSPHLVTIFDVRHNLDGTPFVIMEFVSGPSLRQIIDEAPAGLGTQKAAFFLREIGKGLTYLHDCGIVHRDLKPGNIFYENGYVKIGDYGLSKAMSATQNSQQTITVGTVHYMAPEIGMGRYDKSIDIYALGAVLYEMLTGQPPYLGASPTEVLMKHISSEPDVRNIEEPFATVIRKAMARDPKERYQNVQEMVEAVFGASHIRESVSCFSPESLSMVAARVAQHAYAGGSSTPIPQPPPLPQKDSGDFLVNVGQWADRMGQRLGQRMTDAGERFANKVRNTFGGRHQQPEPPTPGAVPVPLPPSAADELRDPIPRRQRGMLMLITLVLVAIGTALVADRNPSGFQAMLLTLGMSAGAIGGFRLARARLLPKLIHEGPFIQRLAAGGMASIIALAVSIPVILADHALEAHIGPIWAPIAVGLVLFCWRDATFIGRRHRVALGPAIFPVIIGAIVAGAMDGSPEVAIGVLAGTALAAQIAFPWDPFHSRNRAAVHAAIRADGPPPMPAPQMPNTCDSAVAGDALTTPPAPFPPPIRPPVLAAGQPFARPAPEWARWIWFIAMAIAFPLGISMIVMAANMRNVGDRIAFMSFGLGMLVMTLLCLIQGCRRYFTGWWPYLWRPLAIYACGQTFFASALSFEAANSPEDMAFLTFLLLFSVILFVLSLVLPIGKRRIPPVGSMQPASATPVPTSITESQYRLEMHRNATSFIFGFFGSIFLLAALGAGLATALNLPSFLNAGLADPNLAREMAREFGPDWQPLMHTLLVTVATVAAFIALGLLMAARRDGGAAHVFRVPLALSAIAVAVYLLSRATPGSWTYVGEPNRVYHAATIAAFIHGANPAFAIVSLIFAVIGLVLLMWPRKNPQTLPTTPVKAEVAS